MSGKRNGFSQTYGVAPILSHGFGSGLQEVNTSPTPIMLAVIKKIYISFLPLNEPVHLCLFAISQ
jgi:hypothetical protein